MRCASSARRTCRASRSASEYTATVWIPSRRAVRMTRQAISPRLAISSLANTSALPGGLALAKEGSDAFLAFCGNADLRDPLRRFRDQALIQRRIGHRAHQLLDAGDRRGSAREQVLEQRFDARVEFGRRDHGGKQAESQGLGGVEDLGAEEVAPRRALADGAH